MTLKQSLHMTFSLCGVLGLIGCVPHIQSHKERRLVRAHPRSQQRPFINVWIHGTKFLNHGCPLGLWPLEHLQANNHLPIFGDLADLAKTERFHARSFYGFSWSGSLSVKERECAAKELYTSLKQAVQNYYQHHGTRPAIRILGYSHGGNVALNIAKIKDEDDPFEIEELILLGCPVQRATAPYIHHPLFKKIYSLYSSNDWTQIIDPQGIWSRPDFNRKLAKKKHKSISLFSERLFPDRDNMLQVELKIDDAYAGHYDFANKTFISLLPTILDELDNWHEELSIEKKECSHYVLSVASSTNIQPQDAA